jgi:hypothetical protein
MTKPIDIFTRIGVSKEEYHAIAAFLTGSKNVLRLPFQGMQSYTVQYENVVVQFREELLDLNLYNKAMEIHKNFVLPITCKQTEPFTFMSLHMVVDHVVHVNSETTWMPNEKPSKTSRFSLLRAVNTLSMRWILKLH